MKQVAKFEKVSYEQFKKDTEGIFGIDAIEKIYNNIKLPKRATKGSAGYDFYLPTDLILGSKRTVKIPTGIRVEIDEGWVLKTYPRSSLGFKYRLQLDNTVGIIDSDYYYRPGMIEGEKHDKLLRRNRDLETVKVNVLWVIH